MEFLYDWGYVGLFIISFLAATLVPLSPEVLIVLLYDQHYDPVLLILIATIAGYLGSLTYYFAANEGREWAVKRFFEVPPERLERAQQSFQRWGSILLFFSWIPIIGEPLIVGSGILKTPLPIFTFWVIVGRLVRFSLLLWVTDSII